MKVKPAASPQILEFIPSAPSFEEIIDGVAPQGTEAAPQKPREPEVVPQKPQEPEVVPQKPVAETQQASEFDIEGRINLDQRQPKPEDKPKGRANDAMRTQLEKLAGEKKALEEKIAEIEAARETYRREADERSAILKQREQELNELRSTQFVGDPSKHPSIREIADPWNNSAREFADDIEGATGVDSSSLVESITKGASLLASAQDEEALKKSLAEVRSGLLEKVGEGGILQAMRLVRSGAEKVREIQGLVAQIRDDLPRFQFEQASKTYQEAKRRYEEVERNLFNPPEDIIQSDPLNQSVVLKAMISGSQEVAAAAERVKAFVKYAVLPPAPIAPDQLDGKTPEERSKMIADHLERHRAANASIQKLLAEALLARQLLPALWKRADDAHQAIGGERRVLRPRPTETRQPAADEGEPDISKFTPQNKQLDEFKQSA